MNATETINQPPVYVRWMIRKDIPEVLAIGLGEKIKNILTEDEILALLRERCVIGMIAELGEKILGFMVYRLAEKKLELLFLGGDAKSKLALLDKLKSKTTSHKRHTVRYPVKDDNLEEHVFLKDCGFKATSVLRNYSEDGGDAYIFEFRKDVGPIEATEEICQNRIAHLVD